MWEIKIQTPGTSHLPTCVCSFPTYVGFFPLVRASFPFEWAAFSCVCELSLRSQSPWRGYKKKKNTMWIK